MKKLVRLAGFLSLCLFLFNCSSSNDNGTPAPAGPLFVNSITYPIGSNMIGSAFNSTLFHQGTTDPGDFSTRTFTIVNAGSISAATAQTITIGILYPANQASVTGTYPVNSAASFNMALISLSTAAATYGGAQQAGAGTITVTDLGFNIFKIMFNNVVLNNASVAGDSKTITGYCQASFVPLI